MYCSKCGNNIPEGVKYCTMCGCPIPQDEEILKPRNDFSSANEQNAVYKSSSENAFAQPVNSGTVAKKAFPKAAKIAIIITSVSVAAMSVIAVLLIVGVSLFISSQHDLSGSYICYGRFPITYIFFSKDGTFTARCDYYEYDTGAVYYGKYSKFGNTYSLTFTGARTSVGNAVSSFKDENFGYSFKMSAKKDGDNNLLIWVSGGNSYYAWAGTTATFYGN